MDVQLIIIFVGIFVERIQLMSKKLYTVFLAGGSGTRLGSEIPKQFLDLSGKPVLQQTIIRFLYACPEMTSVVVLPEDHIPTWKKICSETHFDLPQIIVAGGLTRFHSVRNALDKIPDGAMVMVHDGVRPLLSADLIHRLLDAAGEDGSAVPVTPVTDTLKSLVRHQDGSYEKADAPAPDRSKVFCAQTPQLFPSEVLKKAYSAGYDLSFTDDASVVEAAQFPITYIDGEPYNLKITTREDLELARLLFEN